MELLWEDGRLIQYPFLGAIRSAAQMVSYEVSIGVIIINALLCVGSLNLNDIDSTRKYMVCYTSISDVCTISALAETNRPIFDCLRLKPN